MEDLSDDPTTQLWDTICEFGMAQGKEEMLKSLATILMCGTAAQGYGETIYRNGKATVVVNVPEDWHSDT